MATEGGISTVESAASTETSLGPDGNIVALIAYLFTPITGILVYLLEEDNEFARFHAAQSIVFGLATIAVFFALTAIVVVIGSILGAIPVIGGVLEVLLGLVNGLVSIVLRIAVLVGWLYLLVKAYQGEAERLPVIGSIADDHLL